MSSVRSAELSPGSDRTLSSQPLRVICVGLGPVGRSALQHCASSPEFEVAAAVDPAFAGDVLEGIAVASSLSDAQPFRADVALLCTGSTLARVRNDIHDLVRAGCHVISTCEELAFPWLHDSEAADFVHDAAAASGRVVVACGVNPGFAMDVLPTLVATCTKAPNSVKVRRSVDLRRRRDQLREKLGVGRSRADWDRAALAGDVSGHAGLANSAMLCAHGLGWPVTLGELRREPILERDIVVGVRESIELRGEHQRIIELELVFQLGAEDVDTVEIDGETPLSVVVRGLQGDVATVHRMLHGAKMAHALRPGLRLPTEVPVAATRKSDRALWAP